MVPLTGEYRVYASPELARHPWFREPFLAYKGGGELHLRSMPNPPLRFTGGPMLFKGQHLSVFSHATEPLGVILLPSNDTVLFKQPPAGASLEAETTRVTHVPDLGWRR